MRADEETHKDDGGDVVVLDPGLHVDRLARVDDDDRIGARPGDLVDEAAGVVSELEVGTVGAWGKRVDGQPLVGRRATWNEGRSTPSAWKADAKTMHLSAIEATLVM